jgi:hypothetical protein
MSGENPPQPDPQTEYDLFQEDIIVRLKDRAWFIKCMTYNIVFVARQYGCLAIVSRMRIGEAYDYWVEDTDRTLRDGMPGGTEELDHFKHASFMAFWIRRRLPINKIIFQASLGERQDRKFTDDQKFFTTYANEICAFSIGMKICLFYHGNIVEQAAQANQDTKAGDHSVSWLQRYLASPLVQLRKPLLADIVMILKHKNVSPHGIYLFYRAFFWSAEAAH